MASGQYHIHRLVVAKRKGSVIYQHHDANLNDRWLNIEYSRM
jgi:hypothetical protein